MRVLFLISFVLMTSGCASTAYIYTEPSGAEVRVDDKVLGSTPLAYTDLVYVWTTREVTVASKGYRTRTFELRSDGPLSPVYATLCLCTAGLFLPALFVSEFEHELYVVPMESLEPPDEEPLIIRDSEGIDFRP